MSDAPGPHHSPQKAIADSPGEGTRQDANKRVLLAKYRAMKLEGLLHEDKWIVFSDGSFRVVKGDPPKLVVKLKRGIQKPQEPPTKKRKLEGYAQFAEALKLSRYDKKYTISVVGPDGPREEEGDERDFA